MTVSITTFCIKSHYAECRNLFIVMLNVTILSVVMLSDVMLNVIMQSVVMLCVVPPKDQLLEKIKKSFFAIEN